jgi:D-alanyl-D-alanine carboxypeptidase
MKKLVMLSVLFLISNVLLGQSNSYKTDGNIKIDSFIVTTMETEHIPGLSVAVVKDNKLLLSKGYGLSNLEHHINASEKTMYGIASISKTFTAIAVLILVEEKRISLNDTIGKFFPNIPDLWKSITIKQLLNHTSGISSFSKYSKIPCKVGKDVRDYERGDAWKEVACLPLEFKPGTGWLYGDTGYYLLGLLIETITQQKYEDFLKERIWTPLEMYTTRLISYHELIPSRADGYAFVNNTYVLAPRFEIDEFSNGGIVSNVTEMSKLHLAFTTEKILKKTTWEQMWSATILNDKKVIQHYGLGFGLSPFEGRKRIGHNGGGGLGFSTSLAHFPHESLTVILLTNVNLPEGRSGALANKIASFYFR